MKSSDHKIKQLNKCDGTTEINCNSETFKKNVKCYVTEMVLAMPNYAKKTTTNLS